jgi:hypothetical protein
MAGHEHLILRIRAHLAQQQMADGTAQLLHDVEMALASPREPQEPRGPLQSARDAVLAGARQLHDASNKALLLPVPDTLPPLVVALGEPAQLLHILSARQALIDS